MAKKILVIDDDQLVIKTLSRYLKTCGYEVDTATSGSDAITKIEASPCDLIIVDMRMPGMDGVQTIKKLRSVCEHKHKTKIPEIIITGYASAEAQAEAKELGITDYIYKPFEINVFLEAVRRNLKE